MQRALRLLRAHRNAALPDPTVAALVVRAGQVVGSAVTSAPGQRSAIVHALEQAAGRARGARLYVTLEPAQLALVRVISRSGVRALICAQESPRAAAARKLLDGAGLVRRVGLLAEQAALENEASFIARAERRPYVLHKAAVTLDGKVAARGGDARWVSGLASRRQSHRLRAELPAIIVGVGTVLADDPELTCRMVSGRDPIRVVLDSRLRTPPSAKLVQVVARSSAPTWIITTARAPAAAVRRLEAAGAELIVVAAERGRVSPRAALAALWQRQVAGALLEGGPTLAGAFWQQRLVDRLTTFIAPKVLGDGQGLSMIAGPARAKMADAVALETLSQRRCGEDLLVSSRPIWSKR